MRNTVKRLNKEEICCLTKAAHLLRTLATAKRKISLYKDKPQIVVYNEKQLVA